MLKFVRLQRYLEAETPPAQIKEALASFGELANLLTGKNVSDPFGFALSEARSSAALAVWAQQINQWFGAPPVEIVLYSDRLVTQLSLVARATDGEIAHLRLFVRWTPTGDFFADEPVVLIAEGRMPQYGPMSWLQGGWFPHGPSGVETDRGTLPIEIAREHAVSVG